MHAADGVCLNPDSCDATKYATPAAAIAALPDASATIIASIDAQTPQGDTPTAPALTGAIQQASAWAQTHADHRVVAVLATDGLPTAAIRTDIDPVAAIAKTGAAASPSINTFVIGVFGPDDVANNAPSNLDTIAQQGGTKAAFIVDTTQDVTAQFLKALDTIRGARLACEFEIPPGPRPAPTRSTTGASTCSSTDGAQQDLVYYVKSAAGCDATLRRLVTTTSDPDTGAAPTKIIACPTTCTPSKARRTGPRSALRSVAPRSSNNPHGCDGSKCSRREVNLGTGGHPNHLDDFLANRCSATQRPR